MNPAIKSLLVQAVKECAPDDRDNSAKEITLERFAELIIRECAEAADGMSNDVLYRGEAIMQHFGIDDETDWGKGYEVSTQEKYDEFVRVRNMNMEDNEPRPNITR